MADFFAENGGTLLAAAVVVKMVKDKQKGKTSCGCGCENCPSAGACRSGRKK